MKMFLFTALDLHTLLTLIYNIFPTQQAFEGFKPTANFFSKYLMYLNGDRIAFTHSSVFSTFTKKKEKCIGLTQNNLLYYT